jgi:hypothetical protein
MGFGQGRNLSGASMAFDLKRPRLFCDPLFIPVDASRKEETRDAAIGFDTAGRLLYVVPIEFDESHPNYIRATRRS